MSYSYGNTPDTSDENELDRLRTENEAMRKRVVELVTQLERVKSHVDALNRDGSNIIANLLTENEALRGKHR